MTNVEKIIISKEIVEEIQKKSERPVCRLHLTKEAYSISDSHLGGIPYIPHEGTIPTNENGKQLWLCAQINFSQLPPMEFFPREGMFQLFLSDFDFDGGFGLYCGDETEQENWRLVYYETVDATVTMEEVQAKMDTSWEEAIQQEPNLWRTPEIPLKINYTPVEQESVNHDDFRFDIMFDEALQQHLPGADSKEFQPFFLKYDTSEEYEEKRKLWDLIQKGGCKLGGYPRFEQYDPREDYAERKALDTLLFQLDDSTFLYPAGPIGDMDIGLNGGTLYILINSKDLKRSDFSNIICSWACS